MAWAIVSSDLCLCFLLAIKTANGIHYVEQNRKALADFLPGLSVRVIVTMAVWFPVTIPVCTRDHNFPHLVRCDYLDSRGKFSSQHFSGNRQLFEFIDLILSWAVSLSLIFFFKFEYLFLSLKFKSRDNTALATLLS